MRLFETSAMSRLLSAAGSLCVFLLSCWLGGSLVYGATTLVVYPNPPDHRSDDRITGTLNGVPVEFEYQHTYHPESAGQKDFKANYVRFAADGPVDVELAVNAAVSRAYLRTVGADLPFTRTGSTFRFTLPGPGNYYLQLPDLNTPGKATYTVFFFFDDLAVYQAYQTAFATARNVTAHGVRSDPGLNQTAAVQSALNTGGAIYFPPGIYRTGQLSIQSGTTVYLAPGALLKGTDDYNTACYIQINGAWGVRIAGLGTIDANGFTAGNMPSKTHLIDMESCGQLSLDDLLFRNSNSWMLHIRRCDQVAFTNLKLFSGKDGIDPDGSRDVRIDRTVIQSIDDAFAVKSRFANRSCERVTMRDCIMFSCASSFKIGTENYHGAVRDITWDHCDAVDADRGCILYTRPETGVAPISRITWRHIRVFNFPWMAETGGAPFQFHNDSGASISDVLLENVVAVPCQSCSVRGAVKPVFRNVIVQGNSAIPAASASFEGVIWPGVVSQSRPVVFIEPAPRSGNSYRGGDRITVNVQHPFGKPIALVELFIDGYWMGVRHTPPYHFGLAGQSGGEHLLTARATDIDGVVNQTAPKRATFAFIPGDLDRDGDVDQEDFGLLQACMTASNVPPADTACLIARLDEDVDVDVDDIRVFLDCWSGPDPAVVSPCAPEAR